MDSISKTLFAALAITMAASCSNEFDGPVSDSKTQGTPAKVHGEVNTLTTRVANFNTWDENDVIGISTEIDTNIPYVTTDGTGAFSPYGDDVLYIKGAAEVKVAGYYPHNPKVEGKTLAFDVVKDDNPDYLFATTNATRENPEVSLNFEHIMARLVFNFNTEIDSFSLKDLVTTGELDITTGKITNGSIGEFSGEKVKTLAMFIPPQNIEEGHLTFVKDGLTYSATIPETAFSAGNQYTYSVSIGEGEVALLAPNYSSISGFNNNDMGELDFSEQEPELRIGDWYLKDGSTLSQSKILTDSQKADILGIVVYVGNPSTTTLASYYNDREGAWNGKCKPENVTADYLAENYQECTNGIVMAIDGRDKSAFMDQTTDITITEWWNTQESLKSITMAPCADDIKDSEGNKVAGSNRYYCLGLQNTYILEQYVEAGNEVAAISRLKLFRQDNPAPAQSTGWYIPSPMEIAQFLYGNQTDGVNPSINDQLDKIGADSITNEQYWSSSEGAFKVSDGNNVNQQYFGRVKKATVDGVANYTIDLSKGASSSEYHNLYFLAF